MKNKKFISLILAVLTAICISVGFTGCGNDYCDTLDEATALEIKTAFYNDGYEEYFEAPEDVVIYGFYGTYRGASVVDIVLWPLTADTWYATIGGVEFFASSNTPLQVYKKGKFYTLQQAYGKGWLKKKDLQEICEKYNADNRYMHI